MSILFLLLEFLLWPYKIQKPNDQPTQISINRQWHTRTQAVEQNAFFLFHILLNCVKRNEGDGDRVRERRRKICENILNVKCVHMDLQVIKLKRDRRESSWLLCLGFWIFPLSPAAQFLLTCKHCLFAVIQINFVYVMNSNRERALVDFICCQVILSIEMLYIKCFSLWLALLNHLLFISSGSIHNI